MLSSDEGLLHVQTIKVNVYVVCSLVPAHTQEPGNRLMLLCSDMLFPAMVEVQ